MSHRVMLSMVLGACLVSCTANAREAADSGSAETEAAPESPTFEQSELIPGERQIWDVCTDQKASYVAVSNSKRHIRLFDAKTRKLMWKSEDVGGGISIAPNGKFVVSHGHKEHRTKVWDVATGKFQRKIELDGNISSVEISTDSKHIAIGRRDGVIVVFDSASGKRVRQLTTGWEHLDIKGMLGTAARIRMAYSPDGRYFAAFHSAHGELVIFRTKDYAPGRRYKTNSKRLLCLAFTPKSDYVVTGDSDKTVKLWDVSGGAAAITADETRHVDDLIRQLDSDDFKVREAVQAKIAKLDSKYRQHLRAHVKKAKSAEVQLRLTDVLKSLGPDRPTSQLTGHSGWVKLLSFSPDGRFLIASTDRNLFVWNVKRKKIVVRLPGERGIWLPDNSVVVSSTHGGGLRFSKIKLP